MKTIRNWFFILLSFLPQPVVSANTLQGPSDSKDSVDIAAWLTQAQNFANGKETEKALAVGNKAFNLADSLGNRELKIKSCLLLSQIYLMDKQFAMYIYFGEKAREDQDSLEQQKNRVLIEKLRKNLELEKKKQDILLLEKEKNILAFNSSINEDNIRKKRWVSASLLLALCLSIGIVLVGIKTFLHRKKTNTILKNQSHELTRQQHIVENKNNQLQESIVYAGLIQQSYFPSAEKLNHQIPEITLDLFIPEGIIPMALSLEKIQDWNYLIILQSTQEGIGGSLHALKGLLNLKKTNLESLLKASYQESKHSIFDDLTGLIIRKKTGFSEVEIFSIQAKNELAQRPETGFQWFSFQADDQKMDLLKAPDMLNDKKALLKDKNKAFVHVYLSKRGE
jgi:hypothetical protein